ncbi:MAG: S-methyl-5-thioribose-1-phosphate isomerase [Chloroflexota bacterium]
MIPKAIEWLGDRVRLLDQTRLPSEVRYLDLTDHRDVAKAIAQMKVRGAPAIGVTAAYGLALGAQSCTASSLEEFARDFEGMLQTFAATRPTAVSLFEAINRMRQAAQGADVPAIRRRLVQEAEAIHQNECNATRRISELGAALLPYNSTVLTHCNAGPLATAGYGTALGIIIKAREQGRSLRIMATETRPLFQGARLTVWELQQASVPVTLIVDSAAGHFMRKGLIYCVLVGADRIAANGDVANKIGTYTLAVLAREHGIPFYVAAPTNTIDFSLESGEQINIEERDQHEVTHPGGGPPVAPPQTHVSNPAFDVTPHRYISALITEDAIIEAPDVYRLRNATRR